MCAKNITHSATCTYPAESDYTALHPRRPGRNKEGRKEGTVTSQPVLCDLDLQGSGLQTGACGGQKGGVEGRRPLQAQSKIATAVQKDIETPPS